MRFELAHKEHHKPAGLEHIRLTGGFALHVAERDGRSYAADFSERDGFKLRFPKRTPHPEAVVINTGGGLASGDCIKQQVDLADNTSASITTQAAERVYKSLDGRMTELEVRLRIGQNAKLNWLPQETILFDQARFSRSIDVEMAAHSRLLLVETVIFGRKAMGECVNYGDYRDKWHIRRGGKIVYAENIRLDGPIAERLNDTALARGSQIISSMIYIGDDAEDKLNSTRLALANASCDCGASAWGPRLVIRALGRTAESLRRMHESVIPILSGGPLPRIWQI